MSDIIIRDSEGYPVRYKDMGDGTFAKVTATAPAGGEATPVSGPLTDAQLRAAPVGVNGLPRSCVGRQVITGLSASTAASLTVPAGAVACCIQADGGTVRVALATPAPTATSGYRIDDGACLTVDTALADVRLIAQSGTTTNVQITYFDKA